MSWLGEVVIGCEFEMKRALGLRGVNLSELGTEGYAIP